MGQVPWLKTLMQLLPQPGPLESFHKVTFIVIIFFSANSNEMQFTESKVHEIRSTPVNELKQDILSIVVCSYLYLNHIAHQLSLAGPTVWCSRAISR